MNVYLSNIGHRYISLLKKTSDFSPTDEHILLAQIHENILLDIPESQALALENAGYVHQIKSQTVEQIQLRYKQNPIEHVHGIVFEMTTACNFNCMHCRIGNTPKITEPNIDALKNVADVFQKLHVKQFDFIGGEVSKYGGNWLELSKYINQNNNCIVRLFTNGWWLMQRDFEAAGKTYQNDLDYLRDLKHNGVTHLVFSIDGDEKLHDKWRKHPGLFVRISNSIEKVKHAGLEPRISTVFKDSEMSNSYLWALARLSRKIYDRPTASIEEAIQLLQTDQTNTFSCFIDIGHGAKLKQGRIPIAEISPYNLICKAFYRPSPNLRINANGNLSVCPLLDCGEGFGNIHQTDIIQLLNHFQDNIAYKLHSEKAITSFQKLLSPAIFGQHVEHLCAIRAVLILIAKEILSIPKKDLTQGRLMDILKMISEKTGVKA